MEIYGIAGSKRHGKDTLANYIVSYNSEFNIIHFADELKRLVNIIFNVSENSLVDPKLKELPFDKPIEIDLYLNKIKIETGLEIDPKNKIATSPRKLMQYFGTEYVRSVKDNYWIEHVQNIIINSENKKFLIPDVRYPNEEKAIREIDGKIIKVIRIDMEDSNDYHASERSDLITADLTLGFRTDRFELHSIIGKLIANNKFDLACSYDYTIINNIFEYYN